MLVSLGETIADASQSSGGMTFSLSEVEFITSFLAELATILGFVPVPFDFVEELNTFRPDPNLDPEAPDVVGVWREFVADPNFRVRVGVCPLRAADEAVAWSSLELTPGTFLLVSLTLLSVLLSAIFFKNCNLFWWFLVSAHRQKQLGASKWNETTLN